MTNFGDGSFTFDTISLAWPGVTPVGPWCTPWYSASGKSKASGKTDYPSLPSPSYQFSLPSDSSTAVSHDQAGMADAIENIAGDYSNYYGKTYSPQDGVTNVTFGSVNGQPYDNAAELVDAITQLNETVTNMYNVFYSSYSNALASLKSCAQVNSDTEQIITDAVNAAANPPVTGTE